MRASSRARSPLSSMNTRFETNGATGSSPGWACRQASSQASEASSPVTRPMGDFDSACPAIIGWPRYRRPRPSRAAETMEAGERAERTRPDLAPRLLEELTALDHAGVHRPHDHGHGLVEALACLGLIDAQA